MRVVRLLGTNQNQQNTIIMCVIAVYFSVGKKSNSTRTMKVFNCKLTGNARITRTTSLMTTAKNWVHT